MFKTPVLGLAASLAILTAAGAAPATSGPPTVVLQRQGDPAFATDFTAVEGRRVGAAEGGAFSEDDSARGAWGESANRAGLDLGGVDNQAAADALPLAEFAAGEAKPAGPHGFDMKDFLARVRDEGLPEPASWALILLGFAMIGGALRGYVVASRRLARLREADEAEETGQS
jgi:hypothetical protein